MRMSKAARVLRVSLGLLGVLAGLPGMARAMDAEAETRRLMQGQYGAYSESAKGYAYQADGIGYVMKPIQSRKVAIGGGERLYVFAAGKVANEKDIGHVTSGLAGAFVLEEKGGKVELVSASKAMKYGGFGAARETVKFMQFGPDNDYGWVYESGYTAQGITTSVNEVLLPRGRVVTPVARIPAHTDNEGASPCKDKATRPRCEVLDYELKVEKGGSAKVYPITVTRKGIQKGVELKPQSWRVDFDEKAGRYNVPAALKDS